MDDSVNHDSAFGGDESLPELFGSDARAALLDDLKSLIEGGRRRAAAAVNSALTITYWHVGRRINENILNGERAKYGRRIVASLAEQLVGEYGSSFGARNLRRMMRFAEIFPDSEIVTPLVSQLSWTHFTLLIKLPSDESRSFYIHRTLENRWSKRELQHQIERKAFERSELADTKLALGDFEHLRGTFKDPYFLDFLGLKEGYLENELEHALSKELELFILELGGGFTFVQRQKRMTIDGDDFYLDLLFFHRKLRCLVAVELKIGRFKAGYKSQMELYLNWLDKYERRPGEAAPIGLILCAEAGIEQVELLNMPKDNILIAEYWTDLPPRELLEKKLHDALIEVRERLEERRFLENGRRDAPGLNGP